MSFSETIFLFFLALIIFGPKKLPEIARQVGKYLNEFRRASNEFKAQIEQEIAHLEVENRQTILPPSEPLQGTESRSLNTVSSETIEATASNESPSADVPAADVPSTLAASAEHPVPGGDSAGNNGSLPAVATEAVAPSTATPSEEVPTRTSQESHV